MNVGFISLGCSKNLIDTEVAIGKFKDHEFNIVNDPKEADIIVVNTCGFIESAKEEAINTILEMAEYKNGRCKFLGDFPFGDGDFRGLVYSPLYCINLLTIFIFYIIFCSNHFIGQVLLFYIVTWKIMWI